jgi:uncharacterized protein YkwD
MENPTIVRRIARVSAGVVAVGVMIGLATPAAAAPTQPVAISTGTTPTSSDLTAAPTSAAAAGPGNKEHEKERRRDAAAFRLVNEERAKAGCAPLRQVDTLQKLAEKQSRDQAERDRAGHDGADGSTIASRLDPLGYRVNAENTAQHQGAGSAVNFWLGSKGHQEKIMNCAFTETGLDSEKSASGKIYWTQTFGG